MLGPQEGTMPLKASQLRENIYRILDEILETGVPVEIERRGKILRIVPAERRSKLENLKPREYLLSDPEELVHLDWSGEWRP
jgi:antitoxin (DNA-binding transcriptional repressor) of toxin-antitoxin stability system